MKKKILLFLMVSLLSLSIIFLAGCDVSLGGKDSTGDNTGDSINKDNDGKDDTDNKDDEGNGNGNEENPTDDEYATIKLIERRSGKDHAVASFKVKRGEAPDEDTVSAITDAYYHGYKYASWHYDTYFNNPDSIFDPTAAIDEDITLFGNRGMLAGENIVWSYDNSTNTLTFEGEGEMFNYLYNDEPLWLNYRTLAENIVFVGDITNIGDYAFHRFEAISEVVIPDTVERIGLSVFYESSITDINFPSTLVTIDNNAFFRCDGLTELVFNQGLQYVGKSAFSECVGVTKITLTDDIAEFGASAFYMCTNLKTAYYLGTQEKYDQLIFRLDNFWVKQLANTYYISETAPAEPGPYWYYDDNGDIAQWYYTVGYKSAKSDLVPFVFDYVDATLGVTEKNIEFLNSIVYHGYKFKSFYCSDDRSMKYDVGLVLTRDIHLVGNRGNLCGDNLTWTVSGTQLKISGYGAMWDFENVQDAPWYGRNIVSVSIGNLVTHLGSNMFSGMTSLVSVDIPVNVLSIHPDAFIGCNNLLYIYYMGTSDAIISGLSELNNLLDANVYYQDLTGDKGEGYYWKSVKGGMELENKRVAWSLVDGVLTVGGDSALVNYSDVSETPWYINRDSIKEVVILKSANRVGYNSFNGISAIEKITVPDTVMKIAASAFMGTAYYDNPDNWQWGGLYISNHLIKLSDGFTDSLFVIRDGTISIAEDAFAGCTSIRDLVVNKELLGVYQAALAPLQLERIFFTGSNLGTWDGIWSSGNNLESQELGDVQIYCLSAYEPNEEGYYWNKIMKPDGTFDISIWESKLPKDRGNQVGDVCYSDELYVIGGDNTVSIDSLFGKKSVIYFWNIEDDGSTSGLAELSRLAEDNSDNLNVLAVYSGTVSTDATELIASEYSESKITFASDYVSADDLESGDLSLDVVYTRLGGDGTYPLILILDESGVITYVGTGIMTYEEMSAYLQ